MGEVITLGLYKNMEREGIPMNKYKPLAYKLKDGVTKESLKNGILLENYNKLSENNKTKYNVMGYYNSSKGTAQKIIDRVKNSTKKPNFSKLLKSLENYRPNQNNNLPNNISNISTHSSEIGNESLYNNFIIHRQYMDLPDEMKELYEKLTNSSIEVPNNINHSSISANNFNKLTNQNLKNSYSVNKVIHRKLTGMQPTSYIKKIYILKSYKKKLNNEELKKSELKKKELENKEQANLHYMVIEQGSYNLLSKQNKDNYIKIMIDGKGIFFKKNSLIITIDKFNLLDENAQKYYIKIVLPTNVIKYVPKSISDEYLSIVDGYKKIRHTHKLSNREYKIIDEQFCKSFLKPVNISNV